MARSTFTHAGLVGLAFVALALPARAGTLPADALPLPNRLATADAVVVGKLTAFKDNLLVAPYPGAKTKTEYKIMSFAIIEGLRLPKDMKTIQLGFVPTPFGVAISPPPFQPKVEQEGCFFLKKHGVGDFYVAPSPLNFVDKKSPNYDKDIALIKHCVKLLEDPNASLKSMKAADKFLTAAMLLAQYRARKTQADKSEPIDAAQSKLILQALASADWTPVKDFTQLSPVMVLHKLPLTAKDGWMPPPAGDPKAYAAYAQKWLADHADTYRIQKFVAEKGM